MAERPPFHLAVPVDDLEAVAVGRARAAAVQRTEGRCVYDGEQVAQLRGPRGVDVVTVERHGGRAAHEPLSAPFAHAPERRESCLDQQRAAVRCGDRRLDALHPVHQRSVALVEHRARQGSSLDRAARDRARSFRRAVSARICRTAARRQGGQQGPARERQRAHAGRYCFFSPRSKTLRHAARS